MNPYNLCSLRNTGYCTTPQGGWPTKLSIVTEVTQTRSASQSGNCTTTVVLYYIILASTDREKNKVF
jgi:hypothetical protein